MLFVRAYHRIFKIWMEAGMYLLNNLLVIGCDGTEVSIGYKGAVLSVYLKTKLFIRYNSSFASYMPTNYYFDRSTYMVKRRVQIDFQFQLEIPRL